MTVHRIAGSRKALTSFLIAGWLLHTGSAGGTSVQGSAGIPFSPETTATGWYGYEPGPDPTGNATTGVGGGTFDLNDFLGATRYYTEGITGQHTVSTNLEAGHLWNGHETMTHVSEFMHSAAAFGDGEVEPLFDRHATWAAMLIGGRETETDPNLKRSGIAPGTDLRSAAIATHWSGNAYSLGFDVSTDTYITAFVSSFSVSDVVNSSYGYGDPGGSSIFTVFSDAIAYDFMYTTHVVSAGNSGPGGNTVGAPGAGYNSFTVAALGAPNAFDEPASFSSRGPQDFSYYDEEATLVVIPGVRAAVDIAAPGTSITSAFYGGQTGGNDVSLTGSTNLGSDPNAYSSSINGTSFAAPLVAGGVALVASAAKTLPALAGNPDARQSVVVRSLLLTGADKTPGWDNGQAVVTENGQTYIQTTQSLDWAVGAGVMNLDRTYDLQVHGQTGVTGLPPGGRVDVEPTGWDYGFARVGANNDYVINDVLLGGSTLTTSLVWMRVRLWDSTEGFLYDVAQADLDLSVWTVDEADEFVELIARSQSLYNLTEHLSFTLPDDGRYGLRVEYEGNTFDTSLDTEWGSEGFEQDYGLSWSAVVIPEPGTAVLVIVVAGGWITARCYRRRRRDWEPERV